MLAFRISMLGARESILQFFRRDIFYDAHFAQIIHSKLT